MTSTPTIALLLEKKRKKKDRTGKKKKKNINANRSFALLASSTAVFFCLLRNSLAAEAYHLAFVGKAKLHNGKSKPRKTHTKNNMK